MLRSVFAAVIVALWASAASCTGTSGGDRDPAIVVSNVEPLLDEAISIKLTGMPPHEQVVLQLDLDFSGARWVSRAAFTSDASGRIDVGAQAPVSGDYTGIDGMGLFWSARRQQPPLDHRAAERDRARLTALVGDREAASTTLFRKRVGDGLTSQPVRHAGLVGTFYVPPGAGRHPAILVLGGSEGGLSGAESQARLYASHGYAALALAYFDDNGLEQLPRRLFEIPFEYFLGALEWMRAQPAVDPARIAVSGGSRGSEAALWVAALDPGIKAVVAYAPSHVVWPALPTAQGSAWSLRGEPLPYVPYPSAGVMPSSSGAAPNALTPLFRASLDNAGAAQDAARIPIERSAAAVLLVSGRDDQLWPSSAMAEEIIDRLRRHGHTRPYSHLAYDEAGHALVVPYFPTTELSASGGRALGGSVAGAARAAADHWPKVLRFLEQNLS